MKRLDKFLAIEFILFSLLGLATVVVIYDLINLIERMGYFLRYKATVIEMIMYYVYDLPATVELLLPVGFALGVFLVIGRLIRSNELIPILACGVDLYRIFAVFVVVSTVMAVLAFAASEFIAPRLKTRFVEYKSEAVENRKSKRKNVKNRIFYLAEGGNVYYIRQLRLQDSLALDWVIWELDQQRRIQRTVRIESARYSEEGWKGEKVEIHNFSGAEPVYNSYTSRMLPEASETPEELGVRSKGTDEMTAGQIRNYIQRMRAAGSNVAVELVEYHFRFSSPLIIIIVTVISLSTATLLQKGNLTLGIGLGLLLSFLYWGAIQASRAFGYAGAFPPWLSAWLPDILFSGFSVVLLLKVKR